jgi:alpha-L-arabinofuranosidase
VNPGSDTYPLDVNAALSKNRKTLTFAALNPSDSEQHLELSIKGVKLSSQGHVWRMAPPLIEAKIPVGEKPGVGVREQTLTSVPDTITAPPFSVSISSFPCQ